MAHEDLAIGAELNRLSYLKDYLDNLVSIEADKKPLVKHLLVFVENYDMDGFIVALKEVGHV